MGPIKALTHHPPIQLRGVTFIYKNIRFHILILRQGFLQSSQTDMLSSICTHKYAKHIYVDEVCLWFIIHCTLARNWIQSESDDRFGKLAKQLFLMCVSYWQNRNLFTLRFFPTHFLWFTPLSSWLFQRCVNQLFLPKM